MMELVLPNVLEIRVHCFRSRQRLHPLFISCSDTVIVSHGLTAVAHHSCIRHVLEAPGTCSSSFDCIGFFLENTCDFTLVFVHCGITSDWYSHGRRTYPSHCQVRIIGSR